jgi:DNA polymerase-3 subunit beta
MTQAAPQQRMKSVKLTKHVNVTTSEIENEVPANIPVISVNKKKNTTSQNPDPTEPLQKKLAKKQSTKSHPKPKLLIESGIEVVCEQNKFYDALSLVSCATPAKPSHSILANVLIIADVEAQKLHLTVTDLALTIQTSFTAKVSLSGKITVPVQILFEIVKHCPNRDISLNSQTQITQIDDEQQTNNCSLILSDADGKYEIKGISAEEFPSTTIINVAPISLATAIFKDGFKGVLYAVSTDENKYILTGVHIQIVQEKIKFIGTDGHRVATTELVTRGIGRKSRKQNTSDKTIQFTLSGRMLREIVRNLNDDVKSINLLYESESNRLGLAWEDTIISCQLLEGTYPDCEQLLDRFSFDKEVVLEKSALIKALERLAVLTDKKEKGIYLQFDGVLQQLRLSIEREFGKGDQLIAASLPEEMSLNIQFNLKYLIEAAKAISSSAIKMHLQQSDYPAMLVPHGDKANPEVEMSMRHFLMPLYIPNNQ